MDEEGSLAMASTAERKQPVEEELLLSKPSALIKYEEENACAASSYMVLPLIWDSYKGCLFHSHKLNHSSSSPSWTIHPHPTFGQSLHRILSIALPFFYKGSSGTIHPSTQCLSTITWCGAHKNLRQGTALPITIDPLTLYQKKKRKKEEEQHSKYWRTIPNRAIKQWERSVELLYGAFKN